VYQVKYVNIGTTEHRSYLVSTSNHNGYCYRFYEERVKVMQDDTHQDTRTPNSAARDKAAGTMKEAGGRIKESFGALTGNKRTEAQGRADQIAGKARRKKGTWKDRMKGWIDRR
jgi:uncharacterized protein YjbJ (UPF0337 family)